ncbi:hypothetical protein [Exiguobacterium sp.]|uniref:hypothetical protein n=1 Tax=Exiguobacterium sp. TaxID=44751 RepID=UPI002897BE60|nr:hypothetical protein [Exiguobacterium sp.]
MPSPHHVLPPSEDELYTRYILEGTKQRDLADHYGVTIEQLRKWLSEADIKKKTDIPPDFVEKYSYQGYSRKDLAMHYAVKPSQIESWKMRTGAIKRNFTKVERLKKRTRQEQA